MSQSFVSRQLLQSKETPLSPRSLSSDLIIPLACYAFLIGENEAYFGSPRMCCSNPQVLLAIPAPSHEGFFPLLFSMWYFFPSTTFKEERSVCISYRWPNPSWYKIKSSSLRAPSCFTLGQIFLLLVGKSLHWNWQGKWSVSRNMTLCLRSIMFYNRK